MAEIRSNNQRGHAAKAVGTEYTNYTLSEVKGEGFWLYKKM